MQVSLPIELQRFVDEKLASGAYATAEDVLRAGLALLRQAERFGDFSAGELEALLAEGEESLEREGSVGADAVFEDVRRRSRDRRNGQS